jgi:high affinity cAMP-specific and IBMX-insensitive 3',5'-cyclic phosphodiesterase 8
MCRCKRGQRRSTDEYSNLSTYSGKEKDKEKDEATRVAKLKQMLDDELSWDLDVILLNDLTEHRPLAALGMKLFTRFNVAYVLKTDNGTLRNWLNLIESKYRSSNHYHNSTHATAVLHATAYFMSTPRLMEMFQPLDKVICLIAAIVHDVDHPGLYWKLFCFEL